MRTIEEVIAELRKDIHSDVYLGKKTINTYLDEILEIHKAERTQGNLISPLTELCNRYCKNCPVPDKSNDCTDCICTHIRGIIGEEAEND